MDLGSITPILSTIADGIVLTDTACRVLYVNPSFTDLTGYSSAELTGVTCRVLQGPDTDPDEVEAMREAIRDRKTYSGEIVNYTRSGAAFWSRLTIMPIFQQGTLIGFLGVACDGTAHKEAMEVQASRERLYRFLFEHVQAGIVLHRANTEVIYANQSALDMLGMRYDELLGAFHTDEHFDFIREDGSPLPLEEFPVARVLATRAPVSQYVIGLHRSADRQRVWVVCNAVPNLDDGGEPTEVVVSFTDVTRLKQTETALKHSEQRLSLVLRGTNDAAWDWDMATGEVYYSPRWWEMLGLTPGALPATGDLWRQRLHPDDAHRVASALQDLLDSDIESYELEFRLRHRDGHHIPVLSRGFILRDDQGRAARVSGANTDLSERKEAEQQIYRLAYYDVLTGLPNRRKLMERLDKMLAWPADAHGWGAILFIDVDNFKLLNDSRGHAVGDLLLKQVALRLQACVRVQDTLARFGGDEFVALLGDLGREPSSALLAAEGIARNAWSALALPYALGDVTHLCSVSIGIALLDYGARGTEDTLKHADLAVCHAKSTGKNKVCVYDKAMEVAMQERLALEHDLRTDFNARRLKMYLQPQMDSDGRTVSAEALLRWNHAVRGDVPPAQFIPVAEATGLILPLGEWVLETACRQLALWAGSARTENLTLSVNISVRQLHDAEFVPCVLDILRRTGADPSRLVLEVTESLFAENIETIIDRMMLLREHGVRFALDDFGTGYSSLSYLQRMPLDEIKIDRSFIRGIHEGERGATITRMIISLAKNLGIKTVAEGVETSEQMDFLYRHGCFHYQGYRCGEAVPPEDFTVFLR